MYLGYLVLGSVLLFLVPQKTQRFALLIVTPLWILTLALAGASLPRLTALEGWRGLATSCAALALGYFGYFSDPFPAVYENADDGLLRMYRSVSLVIEPWRRPKTNAVLLGRDDLRSSAALAFALESECDRRGVPCEISVLDQRDLARGWPRRSLAVEKYQARRRKALEQSDFVVRYGEVDLVEARPRLLERDFSYRRRLSSVPTTFRVFVFGPRVAEGSAMR